MVPYLPLLHNTALYPTDIFTSEFPFSDALSTTTLYQGRTTLWRAKVLENAGEINGRETTTGLFSS